MSDYYNVSSNPSTRSQGASAVMRAEFLAVQTAFGKLPTLTGNGNRIPHINSGGTAITTTAGFTFDGTTLTVPGVAVLDANFSIKDDGDATKIAKFECSGISTLTTRTFTLPDATTTLVGTAVSQALSNKTITASTAALTSLSVTGGGALSSAFSGGSSAAISITGSGTSAALNLTGVTTATVTLNSTTGDGRLTFHSSAADWSIGVDVSASSGFALAASTALGTSDVLRFTTAGAATFTGSLTASSGGALTGTWTDLGTVTTIDVNGGTIDGATIGASSAAAITGTVVTATTRVDSGAAGALTLSTNNGTAQVSIAHTASANRTVNLTGSNSGNPAISASAGNLAITSGWTAAGVTCADGGSVTTIDINGGTVDAAIIGGASAAAGTFTVLTGTTRVDSGAAGSLTLATNSGTAQVLVTHTASATRTVNLTGSNGGNPAIGASAGSLALSSNWTAAARTCADLGTVTTADINGGTVDGAVIGGASAAAGTFTSLNANGGGALTGTWSNLGSVTTIDINGGTLDGVVIGGASAAAATVTTLTANGAVTLSPSSLNVAISPTGTGTVTINPAGGLTFGASVTAVTWSGNPTHSGNHTFGGTLTVSTPATAAILVGTTTAPASLVNAASGLHVHGTGVNGSILVGRWQATAGGPQLSFVKSRVATVNGSPAIVVNADNLGIITFAGDDGNDQTSIGAQIIAMVDGTPGLDDMPGMLDFRTTLDGSNATTSRVKIGNQGNVILNNSGSALATNAVGGFTYLPTCAGTPTGVPAVLPTGAAPMVLDSTNNKLYFYTNGAWRDAGP